MERASLEAFETEQAEAAQKTHGPSTFRSSPSAFSKKHMHRGCKVRSFINACTQPVGTSCSGTDASSSDALASGACTLEMPSACPGPEVATILA